MMERRDSPGLERREPVKLSVIIPVYNERKLIEEVVRKVRDVPLEKEIIIVEDCSADGTREFLREAAGVWAADGVKVVFQDRNVGKGAAVRRGIAEASGEVVVIQDADFEYDPGEFPRMLEVIERDGAPVVYGSRLRGNPRSAFRPGHYWANRFLTAFSNLLTGLRLTDMETCYKMLRREVAESIELEQDRFGIEPEITARLARRKVSIHEVPISYRGRSHREGKKIGWRDGLNAVWCILKYNLRSH